MSLSENRDIGSGFVVDRPLPGADAWLVKGPDPGRYLLRPRVEGASRAASVLSPLAPREIDGKEYELFDLTGAVLVAELSGPLHPVEWAQLGQAIRWMNEANTEFGGATPGRRELLVWKRKERLLSALPDGLPQLGVDQRTPGALLSGLAAPYSAWWEVALAHVFDTSEARLAQRYAASVDKQNWFRYGSAGSAGTKRVFDEDARHASVHDGVLRVAVADGLGTWTPGERSGDYPEGTGISLAAHSMVGIQVDYHVNVPEPDQPSISFTLATDATLVARIAAIGDPAWAVGGLVVPPASADTEFTYAEDLPSNTAVYSVDLFERGGGFSGGMSADGAACLLDLPHTDEHWRRTYWLDEPVSGAENLSVSCHFRNSGTEAVIGGTGPDDATCAGFAYIVAE